MDKHLLFELKNGLRVVFSPYSSSNVVHLAVTIGAGTRDELPEEEGMAHYIEHCLFKGTKTKKAEQVISRLDAVGGELNAYTTKEETCIYASFDKVFTERAIELLSDIIFQSSYPSKEIEREKTVIIDEIQSYQDSPSDRIFDEFEELLFKGHSLGHNILGTEKSVKSFSRSDILKFIKRNYVPSNMTISISGNLNAYDLKNQIKNHFEKHKNSSKIQLRKKPLIKKFKISHKQDTFQDHFILGGKAYSVKSKERSAFILLNNVLGGNAMNSRLNMILRERNGFAYNVESSYTPYQDTGVFTIYFGTDHKNFSKCKNLVLKELSNFRTKKISSIKLNQYKVQLKGQISLNEESRMNSVLSLGKSLLVFDKIFTIQEVFQKIDKITDKEILQVANEVFELKNLNELQYTN